jgi:hypothetical protein
VIEMSAEPHFVLQPDREARFSAVPLAVLPPADGAWARGQYIERHDVPDPVPVELTGVGGDVPDYLAMGDLALVSPRLLERVSEIWAGSVQELAALVRFPNRAVYPGFAIINVVGRVECVDLERTRIKRRGTTVARVERLAIDGSRTMELPIFVPHELPEVLIAGKRVELALAGLSGLELVPVERWQP